MKKIIITVFIIFIPYIISIAKPAPIRLGMISNITGENSKDTQSGRLAIELAVNEINKNGGLLGRKIELIKYDNENTSIGTKISAEKAIQDKVLAVVGCHYSTQALVAAKILQEKQIILICDTATNPEVTKTGNYIFRVCYTDDYQGKMLADFAYKKLKTRKTSVIIDTDSKYSIDLTKIFLQNYIAFGGTCISQYKITNDKKNFTEIISKIKTENPDIILITCYNLQSAIIAKSLRDNGISSILLGGDSWSERIISYIGSLPGQNYFSSGWAPSLSNPYSRKFIKNFHENYGDEQLTQSGALSYDSVYILAAAIKQCGSLDTNSIRKALSNIRDFTGVTGTIRFDENRNPIKPLIINRINNKEIISNYYK